MKLSPRSKLRRAAVRVTWRAGFRWYGLTARVAHEGLPAVHRAVSLEEIVRRLVYGQRWTADRVDTMRHPRIVQKRIDTNAPIGDCDDHAVYWAAVLLKSDLATEVYIAQVHMEERDRTPSGHVFVLFRTADDPTGWYTADYGLPHRGTTPREAVERIVEEFGAKPIISAWLRVDLRDDDGLRFRRDGQCISW